MTPNPLKVDPTQTITLRRGFSRYLRRVFRELYGEIQNLIIDQDAFGLVLDSHLAQNKKHELCTTQLDVADKTVLKEMERLHSLFLLGDVVKVETDTHITVRYGLLDTPSVDKDVKSIVQGMGRIEVTVGRLSLFDTPKGDVLKFEIISPQLVDLNRVLGVLPNEQTYSYNPHMTVGYVKTGHGQKYLKISPLEGKRMVFDTLTYSDKDGNKQGISLTAPVYNADQRWRFKSQTEKVEAFDTWLKEQIRQRLLSDKEADQWRRFVERGFKKGASRAFNDTSRFKREEAKARIRGYGFDEGRREEFLRVSMGRATAIEKLQSLQSRTLSDVKGMTEDMRTRTKRVLMEGLTSGLSPRGIAQRLRSQLGISQGRSETIAYTELVRAHAEGQLESLEQLGVEKVGVAVEWDALGNACSLCKPLDGVVLKVSEARGMLPRHPRCRCAWLPAVATDPEERKSQKRGRYKITKAIEQSQKREEKQRDKGTDWGPNKTISKKRPVMNVSHLTEECRCMEAFEILLGNVNG